MPITLPSRYTNAPIRHADMTRPNAVATGGGTAVAGYKNSLTGALTIGLNMNTDSYSTITVALPAGGYFAIRLTSGSGLVIVSAFDQVVGS